MPWVPNEARCMDIAYGGATLDQLHSAGITREAASYIMQNRAITVSMSPPWTEMDVVHGL